MAASPEPWAGSPPWESLVAMAEAEVRRTWNRLPSPLRDHARQLPITYEPYPSQAIVDDGFDPDLLGLFVGAALDEELNQSADVPPQVILFLASLWEFSEGDDMIYREEVAATYLHELGHYLGLGEADLGERGLE